jgi:hypothetical protein
MSRAFISILRGSTAAVRAALRDTMFATYSRIAKGASTLAGTQLDFFTRAPFRIHKDSAMLALQPVIQGLWQITNATNAEVTYSGSYTVDFAELEYNGTSVQLFFNGSPTKVVDASVWAFLPDPVLPSAFGISEFPASAVGFVRLFGHGVAGQKIPQCLTFTNTLGTAPPAGGTCYIYDKTVAGNENLAVHGTGAIAAPSGGTFVSLCLGVAGVIGKYKTPTAKVVGFAAGEDSIIDGGLGAVALGAKTTSVTAGVICAVIGANQADFAKAGANRAFRLAMAQYYNVAVLEADTNDVSNSSDTFSTIQGYNTTTASLLRAAGVSKLIRTTLLPRAEMMPITALSYSGTTATFTVPSTAGLVSGANYLIQNVGTGFNTSGSTGTAITIISGTQFSTQVASGLTPPGTVSAIAVVSDQWASKGSQYPNQPKWSVGGLRDQLNAWFVSETGPGKTFDALADTLALAADPSDNHYWKPNGTGGTASGTANLVAGDPVHPSTTGQDIIAPAISAAISALVIA